MLKEDEIDMYAESLANALPSRPPEAHRVRRRFEVVDVWREGPRYLAMTVAIDDEEFRSSYTLPGQYVTLGYGQAEPRFLVIANAPGADIDTWEFLVDLDASLGEALRDVEPGEEVLLSPAEGSGFPADEVSDTPVLFFTTGSGVAGVRPALQYWSARPEQAPPSMALYYGETAEEDFAYEAEFADWQDWGLRLFRAVEELPEPEKGYRYVQHAFEDHDPSLERALIFVSGATLMKELIVGKLLRLGVEPGHIHTNI